MRRPLAFVAVILAAAGATPALISGAAGFPIDTFAGFGAPGCLAGDEGAHAESVHLLRPSDVAFGPSGEAYVADADQHRIVVITPADRRARTYAGACGEPGDTGDGGDRRDARFTFPVDVEVDGSGNVYVADAQNNRVRRIDRLSGVVTTVAGTGAEGSADYTGQLADSVALDGPHGIDLDGLRLYIADSDGRRVHRVDLLSRRITTVPIRLGSKVAPSGFDPEDPGSTTPEEVVRPDRLLHPTGITVAPDGSLLVVDSFENRVLRVDPSTGDTAVVAGLGDRELEGTGHGTYTSLSHPFGIAVDRDGNVYVADTNRSTIEMITPAGAVVPVVGFTVPWLKDHNTGYEGDGRIGLMARLENPGHLSIGPDGGLYVGDRGNHRIRRIDLSKLSL